MYKSPFVQQIQARPEVVARQDQNAQQIFYQEMARQAEETVSQAQAAEQEGIRYEKESERRRQEQRQKRTQANGNETSEDETTEDLPPPISPNTRIDIIV